MSAGAGAGSPTEGPRVLVARAFPAAGLDLLSGRCVVDGGAGPMPRSEMLDRVRGAAGLVVDTSVAVDAELLDAAGGSLRVVANFGVGYDNIELEAVRARGVRAANTPDVLTTATAELAVALMLAAGRRVAEADAYVRRGDWAAAAAEELLGRELSGVTVGLVGLGRIGRRVAELLRGFEVRVLFTSRREVPPPPGGERRELPDVLAESEFVSIHVALSDETRHMIGAGELALMRPGSVLVNTSRGGIVDTAALVAGLREGRPGAAGLDVFEDEPHVPVELRELPNTVLMPHVGSATGTTRNAMARLCAENVIAVLDGREPPAPVA